MLLFSLPFITAQTLRRPRAAEAAAVGGPWSRRDTDSNAKTRFSAAVDARKRFWANGRGVHSRGRRSNSLFSTVNYSNPFFPIKAAGWQMRPAMSGVGCPDRPGQTHLIPGFAGLLFAVMIRQNQPFVCWLRHLALFAAHVLEYALLSMPVRLAQLANGHGPLGRLPVGFRAKSAIFLAGTQKSYFLGFPRHQPSACASLRRSKGSFASFCSFPDLSGNKGFLDASALPDRRACLDRAGYKAYQEYPVRS
ncbi:hypothetical protein [Desulfovibrio sp. 6_1_46AFAA]|uniref:hypothetical protein n=1 Tax=Desulfovibrio sp. 6_1_46AFAA TaxID=665942 RepID=UPI0018DBCA93|nr:hypothetical protein [Desulfovibrio sp. 6_1_46AFAA]